MNLDVVFAGVKHQKIHVKLDKSKNTALFIEEDRGLYLKARTFFINDDLIAAQAAIEKYLILYPGDKQADMLHDMIIHRIKQLDNSARKNARLNMLMDVENAWEVPIDSENINDNEQSFDSKIVTNALQDKLNKIIIPHIRFINLPISTAVDTIAELSVQYDFTTEDDWAKGVNIVLINSTTNNEPKINLTLRNITLDRLLFYVGQAANYRYDYTTDAVIIGEPQMIQEQLDTRFFSLSRAAIIKFTGLQGLNHRAEENRTITLLDEEQLIKNFFMRAGVDFSIPGSNLAFDGAQLIVTNNLKNLQRIRCILQKYSEIKQVEIEAKFLEVSQGTLDELAFRWNITNRFDSNRGNISTGSDSVDNLRTMAQAFTPSVSSTGDGKIVIDSKTETLGNQAPKLAGQINLGASSVPLGSFLGVIDRAQIGMMIRALEQNSG